MFFERKKEGFPICWFISQTPEIIRAAPRWGQKLGTQAWSSREPTTWACTCWSWRTRRPMPSVGKAALHEVLRCKAQCPQQHRDHRVSPHPGVRLSLLPLRKWPFWVPTEVRQPALSHPISVYSLIQQVPRQEAEAGNFICHEYKC